MSPRPRLVRRALRAVPSGRVVPVLTGVLRGARWVTGAGTNGCWLGTYERRTQKLFRGLLRIGDVAFDLGANAGFFTLLASRLVGPTGHVAAFEPLPANLERLRRHLLLNRAANVQVFDLAVSDIEGTARFAIRSSPEMGGLSPEGTLEVKTARLDSLVASGICPPPSFMKVDVEGAEGAVLDGARGMLLEHRPTVVLSAHGWRQWSECESRLRALGYEVLLEKDGTADGDYLLVARGR